MYKRGEPANVRLSNKLSNNEVADFREAMRTVINGMQAEARDWEQWNVSLGPDEQEYRLDRSAFENYEKAARAALDLYNKEIGEAEQRVIAALRALGGGEYEQLADALESGDFSGLAW